MPFNAEVRRKVLLWCDRHCCLCKKACGVNIEIHHIDPEVQDGGDDIDNAVPLCFDCHSFVQHYNDLHPRGSKYKPEELKARRNQVYEEFTRHLVPPIHYEITQSLADGGTRIFPDVGFLVQNLGNALPVRLNIRVEIKMDDRLARQMVPTILEIVCGILILSQWFMGTSVFQVSRRNQPPNLKQLLT